MAPVVVGHHPRRPLCVRRPLELAIASDERLAQVVAAANPEEVLDGAHVDAKDRPSAVPAAVEGKVDTRRAYPPNRVGDARGAVPAGKVERWWRQRWRRR